MPRALIFDLGRVLIPFDFSRGYHAMSALCGLPPEEVRRRLHDAAIVQPFETGLIEPDDFVKRVGDALGLTLDYDRFAEIWYSIFDHETLIPEAYIASLGQQYPLVLLSNTNKLHFDMLRQRFPILGHFHSHVLSYEVKAMKPAPEIYAAAVLETGCRAEECFFTDDIEAYVEAARNQGIDAVQFQDFNQIRGELERRGVNA